MDLFENDSKYFKAESTLEEVKKKIDSNDINECLKGMKTVVAVSIYQ